MLHLSGSILGRDVLPHSFLLLQPKPTTNIPNLNLADNVGYDFDLIRASQLVAVTEREPEFAFCFVAK